MSAHLNTIEHGRSVNARGASQLTEAAAQHSMQQEIALEMEMEFAELVSTFQPPVAAAQRISIPSIEEQEMWESHAMSEETFGAGIEPLLAVVEERKRLEKEATDLDLWNAADYLPEEVANDSALLLDELEQDDILADLLKDAGLRSITIKHWSSHMFF